MTLRRRSSIRESSPRKVQKAETRRRLLVAASELFEEKGYETTTVKDIAERAGVAVGSVFAHFASKPELLSEILFAHTERQGLDMAAADPGEGPAIDRLIAVLRVSYRNELARKTLIAVLRAYAWTWPKSTDARFAALIAPSIEVLRRIVRDAQRGGEFDAELDLDAFLDVLVSVHFSNFRRAIFNDLDEQQLCDRLRKQLILLTSGAMTRRPRSSSGGPI